MFQKKRAAALKRIALGAAISSYLYIAPVQASAKDTTPPTGTIKINNNASYSNSASVSLSLSAKDSGSGMGKKSRMRLSNDNSTWSTPKAYTSKATWKLSAGDGNKTVRVRFMDAAGNWSKPYSDSIILDTINPFGTIQINNGDEDTASTAVSLSLSAFDLGSGMGAGALMRFSNDNFTWSAVEPYQTIKSWVLSSEVGTKTVFVQFKDVAGNWSGSYSDTIVFDDTPPARPAVTDDGRYTSNSTQLHAKWSMSGEQQIVEYLYSIGTSPGSTNTLGWTSTTSPEVTVTNLSLNRLYAYYFNVKAKNSLGLWSAVGSSDGISYSYPPDICNLKPADKSSFTEEDIISITACAISNGGAVQFQFSIDGTIKEPWRSPGGGCLCYRDGSKAVFDWKTGVGDSGYHRIKVEVWDNKVQSVSKEITIFIYRKPSGPPQ